jgi:hypothetical protein
MDIVDFISTERLKTFEIHTDRQEKAIALHNHTLQLGASLMSMIALLELSLRNSTNQKLVEGFGDADWLLPGRTVVPLSKTEQSKVKEAAGNAQKAAYSKLNYREKEFLNVFAFPAGLPPNIKHKTEVKKRQALFVVSHGQIIAQTTFYFWKRLYASEYNAVLWKKCLKRVFPNKALSRTDISTALEVIYATRNRVAHHEPVYGDRLENAMNALDFIRNALGSANANDDTAFKKFSRIQYLRLRMDYEGFLEAWKTLT